MSDLRTAAQQALEALEYHVAPPSASTWRTTAAITALRAAMAQEPAEQQEPCEPLDMAQAYENGYKAGAAAEREACAQVCEDIEEAYRRQESIRHPALRTDAETGSEECAAAIRARSNP